MDEIFKKMRKNSQLLDGIKVNALTIQVSKTVFKNSTQ